MHLQTSDWECVQLDLLTTADGHFDGAQVHVHGHVDALDGACHLGAILQLDGDGLVRKFHQETDQLHYWFAAAWFRFFQKYDFSFDAENEINLSGNWFWFLKN